MEKLISNTEFGEYCKSQVIHDGMDYEDYFHLRNNFDAFLKTPLSIGQFVLCDLDGNVLEEPDFMSGDYDDNGHGDVDKHQYKKDLKEWNEARERVLFEGFEVKTKTAWNNGYQFIVDKNELFYPYWFDGITQTWNLSKGLLSIEYLVPYSLTLTPNAKAIIEK